MSRKYEHYQRREVIITITNVWILLATITASLARYAHWCHSGMIAEGVTKYFIIDLRPVP